MTVPPPIAAVRTAAEQEMTDRATVERNQASTGDPYGGEGPPNWQINLTDQQCYLWGDVGREAVSEDRTVVVADWKMSVPVDTDIFEGDRIVLVTDINGNTITDETLYVDHVATKRDRWVCSLEKRS